jgi:hypothetical protein
MSARGIVVGIAIAALLTGGMATSAASGASTSTSTSTTQLAINEQLANTHGGVQISTYEVSYKGGSVIMVFPDSSGRVPTSASARREINADSSKSTTLVAASSYPYGCPKGLTQKWYCFYQNAGFGGKMLQFKDCSGFGTTQYLSNYGFARQTTSWVNTKTDTNVYVYDGGSNFLWGENPASAVSNVGAAHNDRADRFLSYC